MGDVVYPFRSGQVIDRAALQRARDAAYSAAGCFEVALAFHGHSDIKRDEHLLAAFQNMHTACMAVHNATAPEPAVPSFNRGELDAVIRDIAMTRGLDPAFAAALTEPVA